MGPVPRAAVLVVALAASCPAGAETLLVGVASSLQRPLRAIATEFGRDNAVTVQLSLAASGQLVRQVQHGAPFALVLTADAGYAEAAARAVAGARVAVLARGRLVLACRADAAPPARPRAALEWLGHRADVRLAIANAGYAPYGRAAEAMLARLGPLRSSLAGRLVRGTGASHTAQLLASGSVDCGLLPPGLVPDGAATVEIPQPWYPPVEYHAVLLAPDRPAALRLFRHLRSAAARRHLAAAGLQSGGGAIATADQPP